MSSDLFGSAPGQNLLPCDGEVLYFGPIFTPAEAESFFEILRTTLPWQHEEVVMFGKRIVTARKVAWFGEPECAYTYSGATKFPLPWTPALRTLKLIVEEKTQASFNACLLNLYHTGEEGMGWHSDDEKAIKPHSPIASLSFGAERPFRFKHKQKKGETVTVSLEDGSLLLMKGETQSHWLHALPKTKKVSRPRINLTFRAMEVS